MCILLIGMNYLGERKILSSLEKMGYIQHSSSSSCKNHISSSSLQDGVSHDARLNESDRLSSMHNKENYGARKKHAVSPSFSPIGANPSSSTPSVGYQKSKVVKQSSTPSTARLNSLSSKQFQCLLDSPANDLASAADDLAQKVFELDISNAEEFSTQISTVSGDKNLEKIQSPCVGSISADLTRPPLTHSNNSTGFEMSIHADSLDLSQLNSPVIGHELTGDPQTDELAKKQLPPKDGVVESEDANNSSTMDESLDPDQTESYLAGSDESDDPESPSKGFRFCLMLFFLENTLMQ